MGRESLIFFPGVVFFFPGFTLRLLTLMVSKMNTFVLVRLLSLAIPFQFCWFKFLKRALSISFCTFVPPCLNYVLNLFTPFVSLPLFAHVQASKMFLLGSGRID